MTTTAGFLNTDEGVWAYNLMNGASDFTEKFYDMDIDTVKNIIHNNSSNDFLSLEFMYYDLGKDETYLSEQKRRLATSPTPKDTLDREVLNKWKGVSTGHPLGQERIEIINDLIQSPSNIIVVSDTYTLRLYVDINTFDLNKPLVAGMDLGGNLKGDFSTFVVLDPTTMEVVAVLRTNSQSTTLFATCVVAIMEDLFPNLVLFAERNYNGAIIDLISHNISMSKKRIFHEKPDAPGIFNSKKIRPILYNEILKIMVDEHGDKIRDKSIISEISGLVRLKNGRIDHAPNGHDDTLMAYLLAAYFLLREDNLHKYIDPMIVLSGIDTEKEMTKGKSKRRSILTHKSNLVDYRPEISELDSIFGNNGTDSLDELGNRFVSSMRKKDRKTIDTSATSIDLLYGVYDDEKISEADALSDVKTNIDVIKSRDDVVKVSIKSDNDVGSGIDKSKSFREQFERIFGS